MKHIHLCLINDSLVSHMKPLFHVGMHSGASYNLSEGFSHYIILAQG